MNILKPVGEENFYVPEKYHTHYNKGRITIPSRFRELLGAFVATKGWIIVFSISLGRMEEYRREITACL